MLLSSDLLRYFILHIACCLSGEHGDRNVQNIVYVILKKVPKMPAHGLTPLPNCQYPPPPPFKIILPQEKNEELFSGRLRKFRIINYAIEFFENYFLGSYVNFA